MQSEIHEDVKLAAELVYRDIDSCPVEAIAKAIMNERNRCADAATNYQLANHSRLSPGSEINAWWSGQEYAYEMVRRKILRLPTPFTDK